MTVYHFGNPILGIRLIEAAECIIQARHNPDFTTLALTLALGAVTPRLVAL
ncbi:MAG: hypothetical protein ACERNK_15260 [Deltaproteobacteria bacterium]